MILAVAERGGLYCAFFRNSPVFCHFIHKTRIFCRLRSGLRSLIRLSGALPSLLWTPKVPKKSNMSNKPGFSFSCLLWAIAICQHSPGRDFQPLYSASFRRVQCALRISCSVISSAISKAARASIFLRRDTGRRFMTSFTFFAIVLLSFLLVLLFLLSLLHQGRCFE